MNLHLAFAGKLGSGKTAVSRAVAAHLGARRNGFGNTIRSIALERCWGTTRKDLQDLGAQLVKDTPEFLCQRAIADCGAAAGEILVLDGLRHASILQLLRAQLAPSSLACVLVEAPDDIRFERIARRDGLNLSEVKLLELHSTEREVGDSLLGLADLVVSNPASVDVAVAEVLTWYHTRAGLPAGGVRTG